MMSAKGGMDVKLGETILKHRQARGLSQERLAEQVGVSRQAVSKWEVGDAIPDTDKLIPLARTLGISVDELLGNVPEEEEDSPQPPAFNLYENAQTEAVPEPQKKPGWFATHWYWLGLIPVVWGAWRLLKLLSLLLMLLVNFAGGGSALGAGASEVITSAEAIPIG